MNMKNVIMMIIMAVALVALPTMAQDWQSTSTMQGSGSAYSAQVTAVGAAEVTEMATTTSSTPNNGPQRAKKGDFGPGGNDGGYQDPNFPIGDAWPLALFAVLFAVVITIKKHKKAMKKNLKTWLVVAIALLTSNGAWADSHTMPAGTYYFDFRACTGENAANLVEIFNGLESKATISLVSTATCARNTGVAQNVGTKKQFSHSGTFSVFCVTLSGTDDQRTTNQSGFIQYSWNNGSNWKNWANYTDPSPVSGETNVFWCVVNYSEGNCTYSWNTSSLPSGICDDIITLNFSSGSNGSITLATAGLDTISSGATVAAGTSVNLVATPNTGYAFYCWSNASGDPVSTNANYVFSMPSSSITLTASFYADNTDPAINGCPGCFRIAP